MTDTYTDPNGYTYRPNTQDGDFTSLTVILPDGYAVQLSAGYIAAMAEVRSTEPRNPARHKVA